MPRDLGDLRNLEYLYLDNNGLDGCIPQALIDDSDLTIRSDGLESCPEEAPLVPGTCMNGVAVAEPGENPLLVDDCNVLLEIRDGLAGDASLNWSVDTPIYSWDGAWVGDSPARVESIALNHRTADREDPARTW